MVLAGLEHRGNGLFRYVGLDRWVRRGTSPASASFRLSTTRRFPERPYSLPPHTPNVSAWYQGTASPFWNFFRWPPQFPLLWGSCFCVWGPEVPGVLRVLGVPRWSFLQEVSQGSFCQNSPKYFSGCGGSRSLGAGFWGFPIRVSGVFPIRVSGVFPIRVSGVFPIIFFKVQDPWVRVPPKLPATVGSHRGGGSKTGIRPTAPHPGTPGTRAASQPRRPASTQSASTTQPRRPAPLLKLVTWHMGSRFPVLAHHTISI